jgi:hypothetical protein
VEIADVTPTDFGVEAGIADGAAAVVEGIAGGLKSLIASAKIVAHKPL